MFAHCRVLLLVVCLLCSVVAQFPRSSNKYEELMQEAGEDLVQFLETNPFFRQETPPPNPTASLAETEIKPYRCIACGGDGGGGGGAHSHTVD